MRKFRFDLKFKKVTVFVTIEKETYAEAFKEACRQADEWISKGRQVLSVSIVE